MEFSLTIREIAGLFIAGFIVGLSIATILYLQLTSGIRITHFRTHEKPCPDK
jgi:uncharacterized membrane protein YciS (DUF1049 family)